MPLIVLCGQPASGKSTVGSALAALFSQAGLAVEVVDESSLHLEKDAAYKDSVSQKNTRGALRSAVERLVSKSTVVILDSINNIKGFRYELWCIARTAATKYCVVFVDTPEDVCREWNAGRKEDQYSADILEDLLRTFETPVSRNRWDSPLFTIQPASGEVGPKLEEVVYAITESGISRPQSVVAKELTPTCATATAPLSTTNAQFEIDKAAQTVISHVMRAQSEAAGTAVGNVQLGDDVPNLRLDRNVTVAELRRHKRAFLKLATQITFTRLQDPLTAQRMFIEYLKDNLQ